MRRTQPGSSILARGIGTPRLIGCRRPISGKLESQLNMVLALRNSLELRVQWQSATEPHAADRTLSSDQHNKLISWERFGQYAPRPGHHSFTPTVESKADPYSAGQRVARLAIKSLTDAVSPANMSKSKRFTATNAPTSRPGAKAI